jgi:hypothetical protein
VNMDKLGKNIISCVLRIEPRQYSVSGEHFQAIPAMLLDILANKYNKLFNKLKPDEQRLISTLSV